MSNVAFIMFSSEKAALADVNCGLPEHIGIGGASQTVSTTKIIGDAYFTRKFSSFHVRI